jgi:RNA polymerase sigma-70 factor (ECF subfamily)
MVKSPSIGVPRVADRAPPGRGVAADLLAEVAFVRQFQSRVYGTALALVADPAVAEAVAQEAFVRTWRHARAYGWELERVADRLFHTTRQLAIAAVRRNPPRSVDADTPIGLGPRGGACDPGTRVRAALESLPPEQTKTLLLAAFYGYTAEEIADAEGVPLAAARSRIRVGMKTIQGQLADSRCDCHV